MCFSLSLSKANAEPQQQAKEQAAQHSVRGFDSAHFSTDNMIQYTLALIINKYAANVATHIFAPRARRVFVRG